VDFARVNLKCISIFFFDGGGEERTCTRCSLDL
jgi:hypothetical protein